jgi:hypothetical protein
LGIGGRLRNWYTKVMSPARSRAHAVVDHVCGCRSLWRIAAAIVGVVLLDGDESVWKRYETEKVQVCYVTRNTDGSRHYLDTVERKQKSA